MLHQIQHQIENVNRLVSSNKVSTKQLKYERPYAYVDMQQCLWEFTK